MSVLKPYSPMKCPGCGNCSARISTGGKFLDCHVCGYSVLLAAELENLLENAGTDSPRWRRGER